MTNEDKAFAFANKNADRYINNEDPLDALRDGFLCGAQWKEKEMMNPWHKVTDGDLPKDRVFLAHCSGMGKGYVDRVVWDKKSGGYNNLNDIPPFESITESHFGDYYDKWMEIPELPKEEEA